MKLKKYLFSELFALDISGSEERRIGRKPSSSERIPVRKAELFYRHLRRSSEPQRDPSHTTSKLPCVRADEASPSPPLSRSTTRIQNETPSLVSKKASIHHSTTKKLRIKPYQNNNQRREPETTITRLHRHDDDRSTSRDPPQTNPKKATPSRRGPHQLVETPVRNHLPPDLFPLEVDLGFRRAQTHQSFKHIDG
ncbi:hypothetical protein Bca101_014836 [Brassica carinata]